MHDSIKRIFIAQASETYYTAPFAVEFVGGMESMQLLMQGIVLMVIGMATVFAFLILMILAMNASASFFRKYSHLFPEKEVAKPKTGDRLPP
ncbi:MAG: OadG family protein, partial [Verrucomicrobia bacterium]|nr:OadG family protein [Verrucomicrobiota bacterium]